MSVNFNFMFSLQVKNTHIFACVFLAAYVLFFSALNNFSKKKAILQKPEGLAATLLASVPKGDYFSFQRCLYLSGS
jgi:hypothetical protein